MHEMGIALQVIEIASGAIPEDAPQGSVETVKVKVGKLSAVVPDSLQFCFEIAIKDTPLDGARLVIEEIPVVAQCDACRHQWTVNEAAFFCPVCNSGDIQLLSGRELQVEAIEIRD